MNRKITLLALAGRGDFFGASGLPNFVTPSAATACLAKKLSSDKRPVRASPVKPAPASQRNSRRVRPQKPPAGREELEEKESIMFLRPDRNSPRFGAGAVAIQVILAKGFKVGQFGVVAIFLFRECGGSFHDGVSFRRGQLAQLGGSPLPVRRGVWHFHLSPPSFNQGN